MICWENSLHIFWLELHFCFTPAFVSIPVFRYWKSNRLLPKTQKLLQHTNQQNIAWVRQFRLAISIFHVLAKTFLKTPQEPLSHRVPTTGYPSKPDSIWIFFRNSEPATRVNLLPGLSMAIIFTIFVKCWFKIYSFAFGLKATLHSHL